MGFYTYHIVSSYTHLVTMNHNDIMVRSTTIQIHQAYPLSHQSQSQINTMRNSGNVIYIYIYIYMCIYIYIYIYVCVYARWIRDGMMFKTQQDPYSRKNRVVLVCFPIDWSTEMENLFQGSSANPRNDYSILNRRCVTGTWRERGWLAP